MVRMLMSWLVAGILATSHAEAASLSVLPIKLEVIAPNASSVATLKNEGDRPLNVQIRLFRWAQTDGDDKLVPTQDVVASPPIASIPANGEYHVRIMRTLRTPVLGEENYRLVVDELPDINRQRNGVVAIVMRYIIPVFFLSADASQPKLSWSMVKRSGKVFLAAANSGDKESRIADLSLGEKVVAKGLAGYVLGHSTKVWAMNGLTASTVKASSEQGPFDAPLLR